MRLAVVAGGKAEQHRWLPNPLPTQVYDCRSCQRMRVDIGRACLLDREQVRVRGYGVLGRREIVELASAEKPWESILAMRDAAGRPVCPIALVEDEERRWVAHETDASEYGRPVDWTERTETIFRLVRSAKAEAQNVIRETMKKNQARGQ